ncbi:MAG: DUF4352 domain-containing protein [Candidatus Diapherotrites archaeon]
MVLLKSLLIVILLAFVVLSGCTSSQSQQSVKCSDGSYAGNVESCPINQVQPQNESSTETPSQPEPEVEVEPEPVDKTAGLSEIVMVDDLSYKVVKAESFTEMGTSFLKKETTGKFVKVYLVITNESNKSKNIFSTRLTLIDSEGREFDKYSVASMYIADGLSFGEQLQPGLGVEGAEVFELPEDASGLKLEIKGDWLSITKIIVSLDRVTDIGKDTTLKDQQDEQMDELMDESKKQTEELMNQCNAPFACSSSCSEYLDVGQKDCPSGQLCCLEN